VNKLRKDEAFQAGEASELEGGMFYPVGYIVAGIPERGDAQRLQRSLAEAGWAQDECILASADSVAKAAAAELESRSIIAAIGSSAQVREQQLKLAREGCDFLIVKAESDEDSEKALKLLAQVPVRYAVRYGRLAIEDLIGHIPSATADREKGRKV
jgi:hypothetical protein